MKNKVISLHNCGAEEIFMTRNSGTIKQTHKHRSCITI